jgi:hypothetical protein
MILAILALIVFVAIVGAVAHRANRPVSRATGKAAGKAASKGRASGTKTGTSGKATGRTGGGRGSWLLKAWNASGAPKTSETTLGGAGAVLTGKAAGAGARGGRWFTANAARGGWWVSKKTGKTGAWFATRTLIPFDKWLERKRTGLETAAGLPERPADATPTKPSPAATPPPVFVNPTRKSSKGASVSGPTVNGSVPSTLAPHLNYINDFEPDSDAELLNMMGAEVAGKAAEAEAYMELFDRCVSGRGLDPQAMQGVSDYSEAIAESAEAMKRAHQQFVSIYEAIIDATNNGVVMPHDGRFFSGESAA